MDKRGLAKTVLGTTAITCAAVDDLTARILFVDMDLPKPKYPLGGWLKKLFGNTEPPSPPRATEDVVLARAETATGGLSLHA